MSVTSMLSSADAEILATAAGLISGEDYDGLYANAKLASHYCLVLLLGQLKAGKESAFQIRHEGIQQLLKNCTILPGDFEELGRPRQELIKLDLRHLGSPIFHPLCSGTKVLLQDHENLYELNTADLLSHQSSEESRSNGFHHLPPFQTGNVLVAPGGRYYLVYKRNNQTGEIRQAVYCAGQTEPVATFGDLFAEFISEHELLVRNYWESIQSGYGGCSIRDLNPPEISVLNLETGQSVDYKNRSEWSIPHSFSIKDASRDGKTVLIREKRIEFSGCCGHEFVKYFVRTNCGSPTFADFKFGDESQIGSGYTSTAHLSSGARYVVLFRNDVVEIWNWQTASLEKKLEFEYDSDRLMVFDPVNDFIGVTSNYELMIFSLRTMSECIKLREHKPHNFLFVDGYLLADGWYGWVAYALGARTDSNWEPALELRRISLLAPEQITAEQKERVEYLAKTESWLSPAQKRFLNSLAYFVNESWRS